MNFCDSFFFQFFDKFFHVTVECFLGEHVLKGEGTALFDYAQSFSDHIPFILGGTDFVEDKVADSGIEGLIRIFQMGGKKELGAMPRASVILLSTLAVTWVLILLYVGREYLKNRKK